MKDIPGQKKIPYTYHSLVLGYPIPGFLILGYLSLFWDIPAISQKPQKISLGYPAPGHIPGLSLRYSRDIPKQVDLSQGSGFQMKIPCRQKWEFMIKCTAA
jgi:hypothetical protein